VQSNVEPKFIYLYRVIENDLDHPWMITGNICAPLQLEMINNILFFSSPFLSSMDDSEMIFAIHGQLNHQKLEETNVLGQIWQARTLKYIMESM
jgi:hypothetical protein